MFLPAADMSACSFLLHLDYTAVMRLVGIDCGTVARAWEWETVRVYLIT